MIFCLFVCLFYPSSNYGEVLCWIREDYDSLNGAGCLLSIRQMGRSGGQSHACSWNHITLFAREPIHPQVLDCRRLLWLLAHPKGHSLLGLCHSHVYLHHSSDTHLTPGFSLRCGWVSTMDKPLEPDFSFSSSFSDILWHQTGALWGHFLNFWWQKSLDVTSLDC